jgi:hypothetical protein
MGKNTVGMGLYLPKLHRIRLCPYVPRLLCVAEALPKGSQEDLQSLGPQPGRHPTLHTYMYDARLTHLWAVTPRLWTDRGKLCLL